MTTTPDLGIPLIAGQQAQPEITHNEALILLQALMSGVIDRGPNTPPGGPTEGDSYIIGAAPTGAWAGKADKVAIYYGGAWRFVPDVDSSGTDIPIGARHEGLRLWVRDEDALYVWTQTGSPPALAWVELQTGGGGGASAFTGLSDTPANYSGQAGGVPQVNLAEDGLVFAPYVYDVGLFVPGVPDGSIDILQKIMAVRDITIPANMTGAQGHVSTNPDAQYDIDVRDDGVSIGIISISTGGVFTFSTAGSPPAPVSVAAGSRITFHAPGGSPPEASIADIAVTVPVLLDAVS